MIDLCFCSYLKKNTYQWPGEYKIYGTEGFSQGVIIRAITEKQPIQCGTIQNGKRDSRRQRVDSSSQKGQTVEYYSRGVMEQASGAVGGSSFFALNNYAPAYIGIDSPLRLAGQAFMPYPCYASEHPIAPGSTVKLTPSLNLVIWWDKVLTTGSMFSDPISMSLRFDMTGKTNLTVSYVDDHTHPGSGKWIIGGDDESMADTLITE